MKKRTLALVIGLLLIGFNAFAADGDLIVNGNVGIGTPTPGSSLSVYTTTSNPVASFLTDGVASNIFSEAYSNTSSIAIGAQARRARGTYSSPSDVVIGDRIGNMLFSGYSGGAFRAVAAFEAYVDSGTISSSSLPSFLRFSTTPDGFVSRVERMRIANNGYVGIGNTNPAYLLEMEASSGGYYKRHDEGDPPHGWISPSSNRWKSSIAPITGALDTVLKLNGVSFKWKKRTDVFETDTDGTKEYVSSTWSNDPNAPDDVGLIGEDVMKVLPQVVDVDQKDPNFARGIAYSKIVAVLIEAIKEQQKAITDLQSQVETLKAR